MSQAAALAPSQRRSVQLIPADRTGDALAITTRQVPGLPVADGETEAVNLIRDIFEWARGATPASPTSFDITGPIFSRPYSRIYRIDFVNSRRSLAAKICLEKKSPDVEFARRQYDDVRLLFERMKSNPRYRIPEAIALIADHATILMEWLDAEPLLELLARRQICSRKLLECVTEAGAWLRHFHRLGPSRTVVASESMLQTELDRVRKTIHRERVESPAITAAMSALEAATPAVCGIRIEHCRLHGDFQPGNVMFSGTAVYGLDMSWPNEGPALNDAAHMLNNIQRLSKMPKGFHLAPFLGRLEQAFERGYFGEIGYDTGRALAWFRALDNVQFLARHFHHVRTPLHGWYLGRMQSTSISKSLNRVAS